ncbi:hypothetical protein AC623_09035 [Bacillus sp. FJAT-27231]|nr:hypothetical protein AC623_09035 [Bacillus sp. FJAT-27231]
MIFRGRYITSEEAERIRLVNGVFPADEFHKCVLESSNNLAGGSPNPLTLLKQEITACFETKDAVEGIQASAESVNLFSIGNRILYM